MPIEPALFTKVLDDRSLREACEIAADLGYAGVEPMCRDPHLGAETPMAEVERLGETLDELGLAVPCLATYTGMYTGKSDAEREAELDALETFLEFADALDCPLVRHLVGGPSPRDAGEDEFRTAAEWYRRAADRAGAYGVTLGIEIHAHHLSETTASTERLLGLIDRENVGAIHDAGNMHLVGDEYGASSVRALEDGIVHVHVKDLVGDVDDFEHRLLGEGDVDHGPLFETLREVGYEGFASAECHAEPEGPDGDVAIAEHELARLGDLLDAPR